MLNHATKCKYIRKYYFHLIWTLVTVYQNRYIWLQRGTQNIALTNSQYSFQPSLRPWPYPVPVFWHNDDDVPSISSFTKHQPYIKESRNSHTLVRSALLVPWPWTLQPIYLHSTPTYDAAHTYHFWLQTAEGYRRYCTDAVIPDNPFRAV